MDFTIAIPTYNGAQRLPNVLRALQDQQLVPGIVWEVLVIDNNSQDHTAQVVQEWQDKALGFLVRYCHEPQQGAAFARQRAIRESASEWIGFLDDDVTPNRDWLAVAVQVSTQSQLYSSKLGAFSGKIQGVYEVEPPQGFNTIKHFLAIRDHGNRPCKFTPECLHLPPAASLVIRRSAWLESVPNQPRLTGKRPGLFIQGDDYEPLMYLHKYHWEIWYTPDLCVSHHIPATRFDRTYLLTLAKGCGLATFQLRLILSEFYLEIWVLLLRTILGNIRRLILHWLTYKNRINEELIPGFYWAFYYGSLVSPFIQSNKKD